MKPNGKKKMRTFPLIFALYGSVASADMTISAVHRQWSYDPAMEWHYDQAIYSRDIDTRANGFAVGYRAPWYQINAAYLGHMEERFTGTRGGTYTSRVAETDTLGLNLAVTPRVGPVYFKVGQWLNYHYNIEHGREFGGAFRQRHTGWNRSGEYGAGIELGKVFVEVTYLNSVYTRQSSVGAEHRQMYLLQIGKKF